ncbi:MAG: DUF2268 domain-containing putative Zn-dependent protease [Bacillota bacterium]
MRLHNLYPDFEAAWRRSPTWESIREGYVLPHQRFLSHYHLNWVEGGPVAPSVVEEDYRKAWVERPGAAVALVERLAGLPLAAMVEAACRAPEAYLRPRREVRVYGFVGLETTSAAQLLVDGEPAVALALEAWGDNFLGLPMHWEDLPLLMAHEFTHVVRYTESETGLARAFREGGFDYGRALNREPLLEFLVDEGLGVYLSQQMTPGADERRALFFHEDDLRWCHEHEAQLWAGVEPHLAEPPGFKGYRRYFSIAAEGLPPRTGYFLGYRLVSRFLADHPEITPAQAVRLPAERFLPSLDGLGQ